MIQHAQEYLFQRIRELLPDNKPLVDVVAELLFVSQDSAYRRIRGETGLVLEEARVLCGHFNISLDGLLHSIPNSVQFYYNPIGKEDASFENYLKGILQHLKNAQNSGGEILYLTKDIPVFYNFLYRPLFAFRYFFWMKSILRHPQFAQAKFSFEWLPYSLEELGQEILKAYNSLPSTEIWNSECINSTISQIEYYREAGYFQTVKDADTIYESLIEVLEHLRFQAESGAKFLPGQTAAGKKDNFQFFFNRVVLGDNTVLVNVNGKRSVFLTYDVLNFMVTHDEQFCQNTFEKVQTLIKRATLLSNANEKQRNIFFNLLLRKIPRTASYLNTHS